MLSAALVQSSDDILCVMTHHPLSPVLQTRASRCLTGQPGLCQPARCSMQPWMPWCCHSCLMC
jgi:hypothetical protein